MKTHALVTVLFCVLAVATTATADDQAEPAAKQSMQATFERLALTDEQIEQAGPALEAAAASRDEILSRYGLGPDDADGAETPSRRQLRAMRKEMNSLRTTTRAELQQILTAEQLAEYELMQQERREAIRARVRGER